jgi:hypothetical protein
MPINIPKEKVKEYNDRYYAKNKTKILEFYGKQMICPTCFGSYTKYNKSRHEKSRNHLSFTNMSDPIVQLRQTEAEFYRVNFNFVQEYNNYCA